MNEDKLDKLVEEIYNAVRYRTFMYSDEEKESELKIIREVVEPLVEMIEKAKETKKYLYLECGNRWFNPYVLENDLKNGYYVYHFGLWELKNPADRVHEMQKEILTKRIELRKFVDEMNDYISGSGKEAYNEIDIEKKLFMK